MGTLYWIFEYGKVFCGYLFLMFLWPSVVFGRHLRKKTILYRFGFCITIPVIMINTVVLGLGLFHMLQQWIVELIFYGLFVGAVVKNTVSTVSSRYKRTGLSKLPDTDALKGRYNLLVRVLAYGVLWSVYMRNAVIYLANEYREKIHASDLKKSRNRIIKILWQTGSIVLKKYALLAAVIAYGMMYLSYGAFQVHSYGYGDLYVHHSWISELMKGNIFAAGVYPEAMHCFIYCMNVLFGIRVYSILLFLQGIHVIVFFLAVYLLLRRVFHWRFMPELVLMLFLSLDLSNADLIHSMFRMQITMPMEFGLYTVFLSALYGERYLREYKDGKRRRENYFLFTMALAASMMIHFHVLIMTCVVCAVFMGMSVRKVFSRKCLAALMGAGTLACVIAGTPMVGALRQGIPLNSSIDWAVSAMDGYESREIRSRQENEDEAERNLRSLVFDIYEEGYVALYGEERAGWILALTVSAAVFCLFFGNQSGMHYAEAFCSGYPPAIVISVIYVFFYAAPMIGLPDIIPEGRFFAIGHMMLLAVLVMAFDLLFSVLTLFCREGGMCALSWLSAAGIYGGLLALGSFRGYLFYELTRYDSAVEVTNSIMETFPRYSYTIVSPTDELYQIIEDGWHEEVLSFLERSVSGSYKIPSEYVFLYVEKKPVLYAQAYFFSGPAWMGTEKYLAPYWEMYSLKYPDNGASQSPEIMAAQISEQAADQAMPEYDNPWLMYARLDNRTVLESKLSEWCQGFSEL